ncbi:amidohydrolase [Ruegeria sediminis]|uniref:Amidohydrolase n=1 Tax=Ruegeria sediminis TaxID=2583820 RepID=A0ABY2X154_9RHOB|nr:amidohydrolase [Ruegeria sediminis]TMV08659.1 amidohydrolase [Ruegeria sediminis]
MTPEAQARLADLRHELHQYPEISGQEEQTAARIQSWLRQCQPDEVLTGIGAHGVAAVFDSGIEGPCVGVRCELDALPIEEQSVADHASRVSGMAHLCGHDGHMTMVLAVAEALALDRPKRGRVVLIFQPAEETGKGAAAYMADPAFERIAPDYVFSLHNLPGLPLGKVELCTGPANCASRGMRVVLKGKTSHAAAPQDGLSPAAAMARLMPALAGLGRGGALDAGYALTTLTHAELGEPTFGVAPGRGELWVTLRTVSDERMQQLVNEAETLARAEAATAGLGVEIAYDDIFEACTNHAEAVRILSRACQTNGVPLQLTYKPQRFSEDFGQFAKGAVSAMFWLGAGRDHPQLHNPDYDFPDTLIPVGAGIFLAAIRDVLG